MVAQRRREPVAGLRVQVAVGEECAASCGGQARAPMSGRLSRRLRPSAASPMVPVTQISSPGRAVVRATMRPAGTSPKAVTRNGQRARVHGVAAEERAAEKSRAAAPSPPRKPRARPRSSPSGRARSAGNRPASRPWRRGPRGSRRAPCGAIEPAGSSGREMHARPEASTVSDEIVPGPRPQARPRRPCSPSAPSPAMRREIAGDQLVLAEGRVGHGASRCAHRTLPARLARLALRFFSSSPARDLAGDGSRTALTSPARPRRRSRARRRHIR